MLPQEPALEIVSEVEGLSISEVSPSEPPSYEEPQTITAAPMVETAEVYLNSPLVSKAQLTQNMRDRKALDDLPAIVKMPSNEILKIHFITEYQDLKGQWVYHNWYRNNVQVARIRVRPQKNKMLTFSSKNIDKKMLGAWKVSVVNQKNDILALGEFEVEL